MKCRKWCAFEGNHYERSMLIRLSPMTASRGVFPVSIGKLPIGERLRFAADPQQGAQGVEGVKAPVKADKHGRHFCSRPPFLSLALILSARAMCATTTSRCTSFYAAMLDRPPPPSFDNPRHWDAGDRRHHIGRRCDPGERDPAPQRQNQSHRQERRLL